MQVITNTIKDQRKMAYMFWAFAFALVILAGAYLFLINKTVINIVERQSIESKIDAMSSTVSQLETQNLALTGKITPEYAAELGFAEAENPQYISYDTAGAGVAVGIGSGAISFNAK